MENIRIIFRNKQGIDDPQTEADRRAQQCILTTLKKRFPNVTVVAEEDLSQMFVEQLFVGEDAPEVLRYACPAELKGLRMEDLVVWVDPLDGTREYTSGHKDHVTTMIGVSHKGRPVGGVIHQPFPQGLTGRTIWGLVGLGAFDSSTGAAIMVGGESERTRLAMTLSHSNKNMEAFVKALSPESVVREGGAGNKVLKLLEDKADLYVHLSSGSKRWDTCAGEALLLAAGGHLTDCHGNRIEYNPHKSFLNEQGVVATRNQYSYKKAISILHTLI